MSRILKSLINIIYYLFIAFVVVVVLFLIGSVLPIPGNYKVFVVQSGSMEPKIKMGDIVAIKPSADYKVGEVISFGAFGKNKSPITHRIAEIKEQNGEKVFITKGDANDATDPEPVKKKDILGKVIFSLPYLGYAVDFAKKPAGFVLLVIVPAVIVIADESKNIYQEIKKKKIKNEA